MTLKKLLSKLCMLTILLFVTANTLNAVIYEPLPNWPTRRGFNYWLDMADYQNLLSSNMPYQILQGYIVADSLVRSAPSSRFLPDLVKQLNLNSDTVAYLYKYWYLLNEYDPIRFQAFLRKKHTDAKLKGHTIQSSLYMHMYTDPRLNYVYPAYILHIFVNNTVHVDTMNTKSRGDWSKTIAYCNVLDTLKGKVFPSLDNAIFYNGESQDTGILTGDIYLVPNQTDVVFYYVDQWQRWDWGPSLLDNNGNHWIKPNREYIVFLEFWGEDNLRNPDGSASRHYYSIAPYRKDGSRNMYPIENGNVLDEKNALGFGTVVPVDVFKQNIRNQINEIKNFGE